MATVIPVSFRVAPFPDNADYTPQEFADALVARLSIESPTTISFFVSGPTAPTSNVGPWLKNGVTWYVWDTPTASYVPQVIESQSLRYIFQNGAPDHNFYTFWGSLNGTGKAQSIQYFWNGDWHDVYEDTFALYTKTVDMNTAIDNKIATALVPYSTTIQMNTAIQAAVQGVAFGKGAFQVVMGSSQHQAIAVSDSGTITPIFNVVAADPDGCFSGNKYTCPANGYYIFNVILQVNADDSNTTDLGTICNILKNAGVGIAGNVLQSQADPSAAMAQAVTVGPVLMNIGDQVYVTLDYTITVTAPSGILVGGGGPAGAQFSGLMVRSA